MEFKRLFDAVCEELADQWTEGTTAYIREHRPDLHTVEREAKALLEQAWRRRDMAEFKEHLEVFRAACMAEIEAYHDSKGELTNAPNTTHPPAEPLRLR